MVFLVVIFFWMAFHQNGLTMTWFARDYTVTQVGPATYLLFNIWSLLSLGLAATGLVLLLKPSSDAKTRAMGGGLAVVFASIAYFLFFKRFDPLSTITPVIFQHFNAFFVVFLTPVVVGAFAWLRARGKEPSTPRKIGIGMVIATVGFLVLLVGSLNLGTPQVVEGSPVGLSEEARVSAQWLVNSYLILTFAELFLSPMGLSFVSKVAPPRLQGLMQGGWLGATAIGNKFVLVGALVWTAVPVWATWTIFIVCMVAAAVVMFAMLKFLERVTG
jgi:POT family proton-dependent oligopeptide transporter